MLTIPQRLALAVQHQEAGRLTEAEALYRDILQEAPQHPHALHLLGVLAYQTGRHQEAIALIRQALKVHGPHPVFHSNLAAVYLAVGLLAETAAHCREALRLQPDLPDAHNNLGVALRRQGHLEEAAASFREALRFNPRHVDARCNLGAVLQRLGQLAEAEALLQDTVRLAPRHAQARNDLGGALLASDQTDQAILHLREAIRLRPAFPEAHSNLGVALRDQGRLEDAMHCFREAIRLNPAYPMAHNNLGSALEVEGRFEEALAEFLETVRLDPNNSRALASLSKLAVTGHHHLSDDEVQRIHELTARKDLPPDDLIPLNHAAAWLHDKAGDYDAAFENCRRANEMRKELDRRRGVSFDLAAHRELVNQLIATFTPAYFERASFDLNSELPIFIVGMMRSGTTLVEQILASHPQVHGAGELRDLGLLASTLSERLGTAEDYPACVTRLDATTAAAVAEVYLQRLRQLGGNAVRVVDKMPFNFLHLGLIATLFPKARIIHCRRDPIDTCLSCFFQNFGTSHPFTVDLRQLGLYYREYERLMSHWASALPVPIFELCYEELTADQEGVSRRLMAFCGLDWDERCLRFSETRRPVRTASILQVRQPMYRSSVGRWKHYEAHLQPLLETLRQKRD